MFLLLKHRVLNVSLNKDKELTFLGGKTVERKAEKGGREGGMDRRREWECQAVD